MTSGGVMERAVQCVAVVEGPRAVLAPCWFDGAHLWISDRFGVLAQTLHTGGPLAAWLPPPRDDEVGVLVQGAARRFGWDDPRGLLLHAPALVPALAAAEMSVPPRLSGSVAALRRAPVRLTVRQLVSQKVPVAPAGMGPPLPPALPAELRRGIGGVRTVLALVQGSDGLVVEPSSWDAQLRVQAWNSTPEGAPAAVVLLAAEQRLTGVALYGRQGPGGTLEPQTAEWWSGTESATAPVGGGGIVLPD